MDAPPQTIMAARARNLQELYVPRHDSIEIIARGILTDSTGRVLLCQNRKHGYYYLPGGHVEFGEPAAVSVAREFKEELGLAVVARQFLLTSETIFERTSRLTHEVNLVFHVECLNGEPPATPTSLEPKIAFAWVDLKELQSMDLRPKAIKAWITHADLSSQSAWVSETAPSR